MWKFVLITKTACELAGMQTLQPFSGSSPPNSVVNWNTETHSSTYWLQRSLSGFKRQVFRINFSILLL